jgi:Na+/H+ antiporter NhaD/arsenite permease-like protein
VVTELNVSLGFGSPAADTPDMQPRAYLLFFGLLIGAGLGGNISPIGASANIVAMGLMQKHGHRPTFLEFVRIGLPFTLLAVGASALFVWFVWR